MRLTEWWHRWRERRKLTRTIEEYVLAEASPIAEAKVRAIKAAIAERRPICRTCLNPYIPKEHEFAEWVRLRSILGIPDHLPNPMLCEACFEISVAVFNPRYTVPGTSNCGPGNLVLQRYAERNGASS